MGVALLGSSITKVYHHTVLGASQLQTIRIARSYTENNYYEQIYHMTYIIPLYPSYRLLDGTVGLEISRTI